MIPWNFSASVELRAHVGVMVCNGFRWVIEQCQPVNVSPSAVQRRCSDLIAANPRMLPSTEIGILQLLSKTLHIEGTWAM